MMRPLAPLTAALVVFRPFERFLRTETRSGTLLLAATAAAVLVANSRWATAYHELWETPVGLHVGASSFVLPLHAWINDVLMALFFLNVGLEIKRELLIGELNTARKAALPLFAALGGMLVPAMIYLLLAGNAAPTGWGVPMATDIAFALGVARLLGARVPTALLVFLTAFAILDDLGAVVVIAAFYGGVIAEGPLVQAGAMVGILLGMGALGVRATWPWLLMGVPLWLFVHDSGVHATVAGVALGLCVPATAAASRNRALDAARAILDALRTTPHDAEAAIEAIESQANRAQSPLTNLAQALHPWVAYAILPLFAFANAGVYVGDIDASAFTAPATLGVAVGLLVGKPIGILLGSAVGVGLRVAELPDGVGWRQMAGAGMLGGIGFTMALFVAGLAFGHDPALLDQAKLGILAASMASGVVGLTWLAWGSRRVQALG